MTIRFEAPVEGDCHPDFAEVRAAFTENFASGEEIGASVALIRRGEVLVDLWGGYLDIRRTQPWQRDTIVCMMSVTKSMAALAVHLLVDRGHVELDRPVCHYWPEFAQGGKAAMTVRTVLAHLGSLPYLDTAPENSLYDQATLRAALARQVPTWPPGSMPCYHSFTYGLICEALVELVDGRSLSDFFRDEIAGPNGIDFHFSVTGDLVARRSLYYPTRGTPSYEAINWLVDSPIYRAWRPARPRPDFNDPRYLERGFASGGGHGNARAMARMYDILANGGQVGDGRRLIGEKAITEARQPAWDAVEAISNRHFRMGLGFMLSSPVLPMGGGRNTFGHAGIGGAIAFGDPDLGYGFSYCGNRMAPVADQGPFASALINAAAVCLARTQAA